MKSKIFAKAISIFIVLSLCLLQANFAYASQRKAGKVVGGAVGLLYGMWLGLCSEAILPGSGDIVAEATIRTGANMGDAAENIFCRQEDQGDYEDEDGDDGLAEEE